MEFKKEVKVECPYCQSNKKKTVSFGIETFIYQCEECSKYYIVKFERTAVSCDKYVFEKYGVSSNNGIEYEGTYDDCFQFYTTNKHKYRAKGLYLSLVSIGGKQL